jgi:hypothetical protein
MSAAPETATRSCKACTNFQWAGASPAAKASYQAYRDAFAEYTRLQEEENGKGFWATLLSAGTPLSLRPMPPYPQMNPEHYGWCRLSPRSVEKGVNEWCSHYSPSHGREGTE